MKVAINTNCLPVPPREAVRIIHALGCRDVEISTNTCRDDFKDLEGLPNLLKANDMHCVCFSGGWTDLARGDHSKYHAQAAIAKSLGCPYIRVFASNPRNESEVTWPAFSSLVGELSYLSWISVRNMSPRVLVENEGGLTASVGMLTRLLNDGHNNFGLLFDPANLLSKALFRSNFPWLGPKGFQQLVLEEISGAVRLLSSWIEHVHVKDFEKDIDGSQAPYCLIGDGEVPWAETVKLLKAAGYRGYLSLEHVVGSDPEKSLAENYLRAKELAE